MPLDPTISLQVAGGGGANAPALTPPGNALGTFGSLATLQNSMNQLRLFQGEWDARQRLGSIIAGAPDLDTGMRQAAQDPVIAGFGGSAMAGLRQMQQVEVATQGALATQARDAFEAGAKASAIGLSDPSQFESAFRTQLAGLPPAVQRLAFPMMQSFVSSMTDGLPSDRASWSPGQRQQFQRRVMGALVGTGADPGHLFAMMGLVQPQVDTVPTGSGATQRRVVGGWPDTGGAGGGVPVGGGSGNALAPGAPGASGASTGLTNGLAGQGPQAQVAPAGGPQVFGTGPSIAEQERMRRQGAIAGGLEPTITEVPTPGGATRKEIVSGSAAGGPQVLGTGPGTQEQQRMSARGTAGADYQKDLDDRVASQGIVMQTLSEARDAIDNFKPGGGAATYARVAQMAQALGAPPKLVDQISNGNLGASQEFQKLMVNTTMSQIQTQMAGIHGSRLSQQEFEAFNKNNPNIDTDPRAIEKIFNFWTKLYQRNHAEQQELNRYVSGGGDISEWPSKWQDIAQQRGFIQPEITNRTSATAPDMRFDPAQGKLVPVTPAASGR